ncbi:MAG TPA: hypothetical protein VFX68_01525 [Sulfuricurvum sp.]|nr:hypothetical protein [Sulfuricurvum sp.]
MKLVMYAFIFAIALILFKAFYLDSLPSEDDVNTTSEENKTVEEVQSAPVETVAPKIDLRQDYNDTSPWRDRKGMPINQLGDSIAEKLKDDL